MTVNSTRFNVAINLFGFALPAVIGFLSTPILIRHLGNASFGMLSLVWLIVGYLGLFDFGLSRSLTQFIARNKAQQQELAMIAISSSLRLAFPFTLLAIVVFLLLSPYIGFGKSFDQNYSIGLAMVFLIGLLIIASILRGVLEGYEMFVESNLGRLFLGVGFFLFPLVLSFYTTDMSIIVGSLVVPRLISTVYYWYALKKRYLIKLNDYDADIVKTLFKMGSWMTVTNIVSPLMNGLDRFLLVKSLGPVAVAYYSVASDAVGRLSVVPLSIGTVLLPHFASKDLQDVDSLNRTYTRFLLNTLKVMLPLCAVIYLVAPYLLRYWIGSEYEQNSTLVMRILVVGILVNALANIPFTAIQGMGSSRVTSLIHLIELPFYIVGLYIGIHLNGVDGAALAWATRALIDAVLLHIFYLREVRFYAKNR